MSKVDWSLAPEVATHYNTHNNLFYMFHKFQGSYWSSKYSAWEVASPMHEYGSAIIERPKQPQSWSGPEDGLPTVGSIVEALILLPGYEGYHWRKCEVVYHNDVMSKSESLVVDIDTTTPRWSDEFRTIKTPEQLAAEERENELNRMVATVSMLDKGWARKVCAGLYDAGYRKQ